MLGVSVQLLAVISRIKHVSLLHNVHARIVRLSNFLVKLFKDLYSSIFVADAFPMGPVGIVPLMLWLASMVLSCCWALVVLKIGFFRLYNIGHIISRQVAVRVVTVSVQGAVVTVLILHWLVQIVIDEVVL